MCKKRTCPRDVYVLVLLSLLSLSKSSTPEDVFFQLVNAAQQAWMVDPANCYRTIGSSMLRPLEVQFQKPEEATLWVVWKRGYSKVFQ